MADAASYVVERSFAAPPALVWRAWTEPALLARWYGPNVETIVHRLELKPGGLCFIEMRWTGGLSRQRLEYADVEPHARLVWLHANADADWKVAPNPRMQDWPRLLLTTVTFEEVGAETLVRLTWTPHAASEAEIACFAAAIGRLDGGWNAGMELLGKLLAELQV